MVARGLLCSLAVLAFATASMEPVTMSLSSHFDDDRTGKTASIRLNLCEREQMIRNGTLQVRDALRGLNVSSFAPVGSTPSWAYDWAASSAGASPSQRTYTGGHQLEMLDEIARRAGFNWRANFVASQGPLDGESYSEYADYFLDRYDIALDWFVENSARKRLSMFFPYNWFDASIILYTKIIFDEEPKLVDKLFSFLTPFSAGLWGVVVASLVFSALVYWMLEGGVNDWEFDADDSLRGISHGLYLAAGNFTGVTGFEPVSWMGKLFTISWAFVILLLVSAYTANLASFLVVSKQDSVEISSIEDAVAQRLPICCARGTAVLESVQRLHPNAVMVENDSFQDGMRAVSAGTCKAGILTVAQWELLEQGEANAQCDLRWVGRTIKGSTAGWMTRADFVGESCAQILTDAIAVHLMEMEEEGLLGDMWAQRLVAQATQTCGEEEETAGDDGGGQLTVDNMGGLFLVHAVFSVVCLAVHAATRLSSARTKSKVDTAANTATPPAMVGSSSDDGGGEGSTGDLPRQPSVRHLHTSTWSQSRKDATVATRSLRELPAEGGLAGQLAMLSARFEAFAGQLEAVQTDVASLKPQHTSQPGGPWMHPALAGGQS